MNNPNGNRARHGHFIVNLFPYEDWSDKQFLRYVKDKLIIVHGEKEGSDLIWRLNQIIFREPDVAPDEQGL